MLMHTNITRLITMAIASFIAITLQAQSVSLSELNIVSKTDLTTEQTIRKIQTEYSLSADIAEAVSALGYTDSELNANINSVIYVDQFDSETEGSTGTLTNAYNTEGGWWFSEVFESETGKETGECVAAEYNNGLSVLYITNIKYEAGQLSLNLGQVGGKLEANKTYFVKLYIIKETNAVEVTVNLNTLPAPTLTLSEMTQVGETNFEDSIFFNSNFAYKTIVLNADSIAALVNADVADKSILALYAQKSESGDLTDTPTANNGGFWFGEDGYSKVYDKGSGCTLFIEPETTGDFSKLHTGIYYNYGILNKSTSASVYIVGSGSTYYKVNVTLHVLPTPTIPQCETVDSLNLVMEIIPDNSQEHVTSVSLSQDDYMKEAIDLNIDRITELLGTDQPEFFTTSVNPSTGALLMYTNAHSTLIDSEAGFLMMDLSFFGNAAMIHTAAPFSPLPQLTKAYGIGYENGKLSFWQQIGDRNVGDYYQNEYYLANRGNKKKIVINLTVVFVEERNPQPDIIAEANITLPKNNGEGGYASTDYDMTSVAEALGCSETPDLITWKAYNKLGQLLSADYDEVYGFNFDKNGRLSEDDSTYVFSVGYTDTAFHSFVDKDEEESYSTRLVAVYNNKGYIFNITLSDKQPSDVNSDGLIDTNDVLSVYDYIKSSTDADIDPTYDVNKDEKVDTQDVITIYNVIRNN